MTSLASVPSSSFRSSSLQGTRRTRPRRTASRLALGVVLLLVWGCGGGGGGGGGGGTPQPPTQPPPPTSAVSFAADASASANSLSWSSSVSGDVLTLNLTATQVQNLFGITFDLVYPSGQLTFESASELAAFGAGDSTAFQVFQSNGRLVVGLSRLAPAAGFSGTGELASFTFRAAASGNGRIDFENRQAVRPSGVGIGVIQWIGGSVTVN